MSESAPSILADETTCREAIRADPEDMAAYISLAEILDGQGRIGEAVGILEAAERARPDDHRVIFDLARRLIQWEVEEVRNGEVYAPYDLEFPWGGFPFPTRDFYPPRKIPRAIELLRRLSVVDPEHGPGRALLGLMLVSGEGALADGVPHVQWAVQNRPAEFSGHFGMAAIALRQGNWELAAAAAKGALALQPDESSAAAVHVLAENAGSGDHSGAMTALTTDQMILLADLLALAKDGATLTEGSVETADRLALGIAERLSGEAVEAVMSLQAYVQAARCLYHARRLQPDLPVASVAAGVMLFGCSAFAMADRALSYALSSQPNDPLAQRTRMKVRLATGDIDIADSSVEILEAADFQELADVYSAQLEFELAESILRKAAECQPAAIDIQLELAKLLALMDRLAEAVEIVEKIHNALPDSPEIQAELCILYLSLGRLEDAWPLYESRLRYARGSTPRPPPPLARWQGQSLEGKTLVIWREEGIGDEIKFSQCLPDAIQAFPGRIIYECDPRLASLYQRSFPDIAVRAEDLARSDFGDADYHLPAGSLPMHFRQDLADFPASGTFLVADPARVARWKKQLLATGPGPHVGIGWRSLNPGWHKLPYHSRLTDWQPIFNVPGLCFHSLQCESGSGEIEAAESEFGVVIRHYDDLDLKNDMEEVAAFMTALDCVVTTQCWLPHLGGALGVKMYLLSAQPNSYTMGLDANPWAPETEVFYKTWDANWDRPMASVAARISKRFTDDG